MSYKTSSLILSFLLLIIESSRADELSQAEINQRNKNESLQSLYRLILYCFISACCFMFLFFCLKVYLEIRYRNRPVVNYGPFGESLRDVSMDELTPEQRKAIVNVIFAEDNCTTFEKNEEKQKTDISVKPSPTSVMCNFADEESQSASRHDDNRQLGLHQLPQLVTSESEEENENHKLLKAPPVLKRRPMFFPLPTSDESNDDFNANENNRVEKVEEGGKEDSEEKNNNDDDEHVVDMDVLSASEIENGVCSICIDEYEPGDQIIKSPHCGHYFHRECLLQWFEKSFNCPVCRVDMISEEEIVGAVKTVISEYGANKSLCEVRTELNQPPRIPHVPISRLGHYRQQELRQQMAMSIA